MSKDELHAFRRQQMRIIAIPANLQKPGAKRMQ